MKSIRTDRAPRPRGHYSQGIVHGGLVYVAGQLPWDPDDPDAPLGSVADQAERTFRNVEAILQAAGTGLDGLLQVTVYVSDPAHWPEVNRVYAALMGEHRPARAVVPVTSLHGGAALEVQAVAALEPDSED